MEYEEYLKCAYKHIKSCQQILEGLKHTKTENKEALLDVWYLSGYILEGFTVYSVYKLNKWNPPEGKHKGKDIQFKYDVKFSEKINLDFYRLRIIKPKDKSGKVIKPLQEAGIEIKYSVEGHGFQEIIEHILKPEPFEDCPVFGNGPVDKDVEELIQAWNPKIRYLYESKEKRRCWYESNKNEEKNIKIPDLNQNLLERLLNTCTEIYKKMNI